MVRHIISYAILAGFCLSGCSWINGSRELAPSELLSPERAALGRGIFANNCQQCHPDGRAGLGPALSNSLSLGLIRSQVRLGVGRMKAFPDRLIPDHHLDALADFILSGPNS